MKKCIECNAELQGIQKKFCSGKCKQKNHYHKVKQQSNTYHSQTLRGYKRKIELIELSGGSCKKCGYSKNISALQFHHLDCSTKLFNLDSRKLSNNNWNTILIEFEKCILLCGNCHAELHHPEMDINNVKNILNNNVIS